MLNALVNCCREIRTIAPESVYMTEQLTMCREGGLTGDPRWVSETRSLRMRWPLQREAGEEL
jgi:hypothetical protein